MNTIYFSEQINADARTVHSKMLERDSYREWTKPFSPTSDVKGNWEENSKIRFLSLDQNGNEAGMVSVIDKNIPGEIVIIRHLGMFDQSGEKYEGPGIDNWKNALEIYRFKEENGKTNVLCSLEISDEDDLHMFDETWLEALKKLKEICER